MLWSDPVVVASIASAIKDSGDLELVDVAGNVEGAVDLAARVVHVRGLRDEILQLPEHLPLAI